MPRIVYLTNGCHQGYVMLDSLIAHNYLPDLVIIEKPPSPAAPVPASAVDLIKRKMNSLVTLRFMHARLERAMRQAPGDMHGLLSRHQIAHAEVENHNSAETERLLKEIVPDFIILGGARIIKPHIFNTARLGTINVHPGVLPKYRGQGTVAWALANKDLPGLTAHFIDSGVDSGPIILAREYPGPFKNVWHARNVVESQAGAVLVEALKLVEHLERPPAMDPNRPFPRYMPMPPIRQLVLSARLYANFVLAKSSSTEEGR